jgi:hypothetical protein
MMVIRLKTDHYHYSGVRRSLYLRYLKAVLTKMISVSPGHDYGHRNILPNAVSLNKNSIYQFKQFKN